MKNSKLILNLMMGHHALIEVLLTVVKDSPAQGVDFMKNSLEKFKWEFEKHIFLEEQVLFNFFSEMKTETSKIIPQLIREHDTMSDMIKKANDELKLKGKIDISELQDLLKSHRDTEESLLYPEMDQKLNKEEKEILVSRINEIPLKETKR